MGGRLLPAEDGPAAQFMYENGTGERLTLHLRSGIGAFYWSDEGFGYAIAARADRCPLLRIAEIVYQQTPPMAPRPRSRPHLVSPADCRGIKRSFGSRSERGMTCSASTTARYR